MNMIKTMLAFGLSVAGTSFATQYEAEDAKLDNSSLENPEWAAVVATDASASGGKSVKINGGGLVFENIEVPSEGNYTVTIHYSNNYDSPKTNTLKTANGSSSIVFEITDKGKFADVSTTLKLSAGENTISIVKDWGWIDVDYITVEAFESESFSLCNAPVTAKATPSAVKLYNFLVNNFGKKTISGVMTGSMDSYTVGDATLHEDVQAVYSASGKYPALVGVDLLNATGGNSESSWYMEYTEKAMDISKSIWKKGGIPAITWHWRPGEETEFYVKDANANYTDFDFTKAFVTGSTSWDTLSTEYKALVGDIDKVSKLMLNLQEEGVAAIFRPLHESGGNWFWWSTHTGKQFAALYQLVYERMVFTNGVNNLIWVFNPQDASKLSWTPGEKYYDVLSVDIYRDANIHESNASAFIDLSTKGGTSKVIALSENGPIPDVNEMYNDGATWSWWMPWYNSWGDANHKYIDQTSASVWQSNMADERIITLEDMPGWDAYAEANSGTKTCPTSESNASFDADTNKTDTPAVNTAMRITVSIDSTTLINSTKLTNISSTKRISMEITNNGSGGEAEDEGVWIGLAFVRNGTKDEAWTWEMSTDTTCWISGGSKSVCEFEIENYLSDGALVEMDRDNFFSINLMIGGNKGFSGEIIIDNILTEEGLPVNTFDKEADLFVKADSTDKQISKIELYQEGEPTIAIKRVAAPAKASLSVISETLSFTTKAAGNVRVDVFSMTGKHVSTLHNGMLNAGSHAFSMAGITKGRYIVRVKGAGIATAQPVLLK